MKVLIIDDDASVRLTLRFALTHVGKCDLLEAASGQEGLRLARTERPDLIVLDVAMPGKDGASTLSDLRTDRATAAIPVIFLTAKAMRSELARLAEMGAIAVMVKPFDPITLADELRAALQAYRGAAS